jgi:hypothetical protein
MRVVHFAKILTETGNASGFDREDFVEEISKLSEAFRRPGESREQAFTRTIVENSEGALLFKASKLAPPREAPHDFVRDSEPEPTSDAERELDRLARDVARTANISLARAKGRVLQDPQHQKIVRALTAAERRATAAVAQQRAPIFTAQRELEADFSLGRSAGSRRN